MTEMKFVGTPKKATTHVNQNEGLIFEKSSPGKKAYRLAELDVPAVNAASLLGDSLRSDLGVMPEVSEIEIIRHFTRLSTWNYAIDLGMYPLGSCTMKYNPRVNEAVARDRRNCECPSLSAGVGLAGLPRHHEDVAGLPHRDHRDGRHHATAGGGRAWRVHRILLVRAYHESKGNARKKILIPDSAHGTNPASAAVCGYQVANLNRTRRGWWTWPSWSAWWTKTSPR